MRGWWLVALMLLPAGAASAAPSETRREVANYQPALRYAVSDDTLDTPFGVIVDAAIDADWTVYLLDSQSCVIHRISLSGEVMKPLGRRGEGPGEFEHPLLLAVYPDRCCLVLQDFHKRAVCLMPNGSACTAPDVSALQDEYMMTAHVRCALDEEKRLVVGGVTTRWQKDSRNRVPVASVRRLDTSRGGAATVLFSTDPAAVNPTIRLRETDHRFVFNSWDMSRYGVITYADPTGAFRVLYGRFVAGAPPVPWELLAWPDEEAGIRRFIKEAGADTDPRDVPRIMSVRWLGGNFFAVEPTAAATVPTDGLIGTFELYFPHPDRTEYMGTYRVTCDYDVDADQVFIRDDLLIVIKGGKSAVAASLQQAPANIRPRVPDHDVLADGIEVHVYGFLTDIIDPPHGGYDGQR